MSQTMPPQAPTPAGWYPIDEWREGYWDGTSWTGQVRAVSEGIPTQYPTPGTGGASWGADQPPVVVAWKSPRVIWWVLAIVLIGVAYLFGLTQDSTLGNGFYQENLTDYQESRYLERVRAEAPNDTEFNSDERLIEMGYLTCGALDDGVTLRELVDDSPYSKVGATATFSVAVEELCPWDESALN